MSCCSKREVVTCSDAPKAIGPYSVAITTDNLVFVSGQLGIDPATGAIVEGGIQAQTRTALTNLKSVLTSAGSSLEQVVKTTVFLTDIAQFAEMNAIYAEFFTSDFPARSAIQVAALPKGGIVEIEAIAVLPHQHTSDCDCQ
ncbi:MAG TPA: RidA family protein [Anaerolineaceae bacterium]|nr:RidA family protein [Anaerolineaceae bacterium]